MMRQTTLIQDQTGFRGDSLTTPGLLLQRKCDCGNHTLGSRCEGCTKKNGLLQRRSEQPLVVPAIVHDVLGTEGRPLDPTTRKFFEGRFSSDFSRVLVHPSSPMQRSVTIGAAHDEYEREADRTAQRILNTTSTSGRQQSAVDFSCVRVHTDDRAAESARAVSARAYTVGNHLVFASGQYAPHTSEGSRLIAHELTHVLQQGNHIGSLQRDVAIEPAVSEPETGLSRREIVGALAHNRTFLTNRTLISEIRDLLGISPTPAVIDEEFVLAVARWQAANGLTQDGRIGRTTRIYLAEELEAEELPALAAQLRGTAPRRSQVDIDASFCGCQSDLNASITENLEFITEYETCRDNPANTTGTQIESCVSAAFAARGISLGTAGTTSSAGNIQVAPVAGRCGALISTETFAHEWSHSTHQRELVRRHGSGTPAFNRAWNESVDWANDEIRSRVVGNNFLLWLIARLNQLCSGPAGSSGPGP